MFREFNVKFENVEIIGGADNLLENTKVTKIIMKGDNKMSSLDSTFKNCKELDTIDGELDLNGVSDIDNILQDTELVERISLKNINNENISANNSFPHIEEIAIGGELYNKEALQNVIASKEWTFEEFDYKDKVEENIVIKEINIVDDNKLVIRDTLEQKAKGIEIIGQTYENLVDGKSEHKLTNDFSTTWTITNNSIENPPSVIEITEIWGNTVQDETDLSNIQSVGDLYVDEDGEAILDEDGNEQYKLEIESKNTLFDEKYLKKGYKKELYNGRYVYHATGSTIDDGLFVYDKYEFKENTQYHIKFEAENINNLSWGYFMVQYTDGTNESTSLINKKGMFVSRKNKTIKKIGCSVEGRYNPVYIYADSIIISETENDDDLIKSNKTTILMPQPLMKVANGRDKLYWDLVNKKYYIEKNIFTKVLDGSQGYTFNWRKDGYTSVRYSTSNPSKMFGNTIIANRLPVGSDCYNSPKEVIYTAWDSNIYICLKGESDFNYAWLADNPITVYYYGDSSQTVETKILEKASLETYSPKTYITTNAEVQPSQMNIANKQITIIPMFLNENKKYTVKFNCTKKGISPIKINLGGAVKEINPIIGENVIEIVTSSAIDKKELVLSGEGNIVEGVYIIADNMSTGELQEDGTYRIDIDTTDNINHYSISIIANNSLSKGDKLYWNNSNKRYEIDRNGEIEIPVVEGEAIDLPRLYQKEDTTLVVESGNIKPGNIKIEYLDIN